MTTQRQLFTHFERAHTPYHTLEEVLLSLQNAARRLIYQCHTRNGIISLWDSRNDGKFFLGDVLSILFIYGYLIYNRQYTGCPRRRRYIFYDKKKVSLRLSKRKVANTR